MSHDSYPPAQVGGAVGLSASRSGGTCTACCFFAAIVLGVMAIYGASISKNSGDWASVRFSALLCLLFASCGVLGLYITIRTQRHRG